MEPSIQVVDRLRIATGQELARDVVDASLLDLPLVLGCARPRRVDEEAVVLGALPVGALDDGITAKTRPHDGRLEVIGDNPRGGASKGGKGMGMAEQPGVDSLIEHQLRVEVPAPGEDQDKDPGLPFRPSPRIDGQSGVAEVHLPFTARRYLNPDDRLWSLRLQMPHQAPHCPTVREWIADRPAVP